MSAPATLSPAGIPHLDALACLQSDDLIGIGMEADALRRALHPEGVVTYALDRSLDASQPVETLLRQVAEAVDQDSSGIHLRSLGKLTVDEAEARLKALRVRFPALHLQASGVCALNYLAEKSGLDFAEALPRLHAAGLDCIAASGIDLVGFDRWLASHRLAHSLGLQTAASLVFGAHLHAEDLLTQLESIRGLQSETGGFVSFTLVAAPAPTGRELDDPTATEYLKTLSVARLVLSNIPHIESNWRQQGLKVVQMSLRFGANDIGSLFSGAFSAPEEEVRRIIRDAGFRPAPRDTLYRTLFLS